MLFFALSILFIFPALCTGEFTKNVYDNIAEFRTQMQKALSGTSKESLKNSVKDLLENSAFGDELMNITQEVFTSQNVDLEAEIDAVDITIDELTFLETLTNILRKSYDSNFYIVPIDAKPFSYKLNFTFKVDSTSGCSVIDDKGNKVSQINDVDACKAIYNWGKENIKSLRTRIPQFNLALKHFSERPVYLYPYPDINYTITYSNGTKVPLVWSVERPVTQSKHTSKNNGRKSNAGDKKEVTTTSDDANIDAFYFPLTDGTKVGVLRINSFEPSSKSTIDNFANSVYEAVKRLRVTEKCSKLMVDIRSCSGSNNDLAIWTFHFLFPSGFPLYPQQDFRKTDIGAAQAEWIDNNTNITITRYGRDFPIRMWYDRFVEKGVYSESRKVNVTSSWSQPFAQVTNKSNPYEKLVEKFDLRGETLYTPENFYLITDGICTGACGIFAHLISENKFGWVIGTGYNSILETDEDKALNFSISGSSATPLTRSHLYNDLKLTLDGFENLDFSISHINVYNYNRVGRNIYNSMEFSFLEPDVVVPKFDNDEIISTDNTYNLAVNILENQGLKQCLNWMVRTDKEICGEASQNEFKGHPCVDGSYLQAKENCTFSECEKGYYRDTSFYPHCFPVEPWIYGNRSEMERPQNPDDISNEKTLDATTMILGILILVFGVIYIFIMVVVGIVMRSKNAEEEKDESV